MNLTLTSRCKSLVTGNAANTRLRGFLDNLCHPIYLAGKNVVHTCLRGVASMKNKAFRSARPWIGQGFLIDFSPYGCARCMRGMVPMTLRVDSNSLEIQAVRQRLQVDFKLNDGALEHHLRRH